MDALKNKRYITNLKGETTDVILDLKTFEKIQDDLEELYLIKEYDKAVKKTSGEFKKGEFSSWEDFLKRQGKNK